MRNRTQRQTLKHTRRHTQKSLSLGPATITWCCYYLDHVSLFHIFWPKMGRASPIGITYMVCAV